MPQLHLLKNSFAGGEISPELYSRIDLSLYNKGLRQGRNFTVRPSGGIQNRPGTQYIATAKNDNEKVRIIPFEFSSTQNYILEFGDYYCRFYFMGGSQINKTIGTAWLTATAYTKDDIVNNSGIIYRCLISHTSGTLATDVTNGYWEIDVNAWVTSTVYTQGSFIYHSSTIYYCTLDHTSGTFATDLTAGIWVAQTIYEVPTPYALADLESLDYTQSADVLYITHPDYCTRRFTRYANTKWTLDLYPFEGGPFQLQNTDDTITLAAADFTDYIQDGTTTHSYTGISDGAGANSIDGDFTTYQGLSTPESTGSATSLCISQHIFNTAHTITIIKYKLYTSARSANGSKSWLLKIEYTTNGTDWNVVSGTSISGGNSSDDTNVQDTGEVSITVNLANVLGIRAYAYATAGTGDGHVGSYARVYEIQAGASSATLEENQILLTASKSLFHPTQIGSLWKIIHDIAGQSVTQAFTSSTTSTSIKCGNTWRILTHGTWAGTFTIEKSVDAGTTWTTLRTFSGVSDYNPDTYGEEDLSDLDYDYVLLRINMVTYTSGTLTATLSADPFTSVGIVKVVSYSSPTQMICTIERQIASTAATADWAEGAWSDYRGWPSTVEFLPQDRLIFANNYNQPRTQWMTKTGNYINFFRNDPLLDSDGITIDLPSKKVNGINALIPLSTLIALTSSSEWGITSSDGAVLTPTATLQKVYGYEGSANIKPVVVGNRAIYLQALASIVRDLGYELYSDSFTGTDLSILSNHLFLGYTIKELTWQQNPDRLVWTARDDGKFLSMTYMREQEVVAWTPHDTAQSGALDWVTGTVYAVGNWVLYEDETYYCNTAHTAGTWATDLAAGKWTLTDIQAEVESIASIPGSTYNEVWLSVKRGTQRYIERMVERNASTDIEDQFFVDCGITYSGTAAQVITGLGHLEGKTVAILADGLVLPQKVVTSGQIDLGATYSLVHIGIPITADLETLNVEKEMADGPLQGRMIKISQVILRLINSQGGWIGPDVDNLHEIEYSETGVLVTDDIKEELGGEYDEGGRIHIRQVDPLPIHIAAILPTVTPGGKTSSV